MDQDARRATVVVIGAGQAGLSAAYHLSRSGFVPAIGAAADARTYIVFDANPAPGGAWQHRWESLHMATVNGIFDLPGFPKPPLDDDEASRDAVPRYFAAFEEKFGLAIERPVRVSSVSRVDENPDGELLVETDHGDWLVRAVINSSGTWTNPVLPAYPGGDSFQGAQLHTWQYTRAEDFAGKRVAIVGGGISAIQQLEEISRFAKTFWYTRREPVFLEEGFTAETGRDVVERVAEDVEAGLPSGSIISYTGLAWTPYALAAKARGALNRRPMFAAIEPHGLREADGTFTSVDVILWATGFRPALKHLAPLHLENELGGILVDGTRVVSDPRIHLVGFGPSQSTVGANRAGRAAVRELVTRLRERSQSASSGAI